MALINQQEALDALNKQAEEMSHWHERYAEQRKGILTAVRIVSDIKPKRGKWYIENNGFVVLDVCDQCMRSVRHVAPFYDFCPHCGADMRGGKDGTD